MQARLKKNAGFSLMLFAFFFLFDPSYALIDPLPDLIGYTILCLSLINLADINDKISIAFKSFCKAGALSALRILAIILLDKIFAEGEQSIGRLLFVFAFAILELIVLIPAYKALFEGLLTLGMFEGGDAVYYKKCDGSRNATEKLYSLTLFFLIFKNIVCALPEFTSLQSNSNYEFVGVVRILAIILVAPASFIWLAHMLNYVVRIKKDTAFIASLSAKYESKAKESPDFFAYRSLTITLYALLVVTIFTFDFYVESVNVLPDFIFYGAITLFAIFLRNEVAYRVRIVIFSTLGAIFSVTTSLVEKSFFSEFSIEAVIKSIEAYNQYYLLLSLYVLECIMFVLSTCFLLKSIYNVFEKHIASRHEENDLYVREHGGNLRARGTISFVFAVLSAITSIYRVASLPYYDVSWIYYYSGIINSVVQIAFLVSVFAYILYLIGEIKYNYKTSI